MLADAIRRMTQEAQRAAERGAQSAAPKIADQLRRDATTRRGNVPPVVVVASGPTVTVTAPDWVMRKAEEKGQPETWAAILADDVARELGSSG